MTVSFKSIHKVSPNKELFKTVKDPQLLTNMKICVLLIQKNLNSIPNFTILASIFQSVAKENFEN